jgi:hypothetical protein
MTDPKRNQGTTEKGSRQMDERTTRDTERKVERNPEPHKKGDPGRGREGQQV